MLNTINGFDLVLIIIITILGFKVYNLTRECESYVRQIMQVSWELQVEIEAHKYSLQDHSNDCSFTGDCECNTCKQSPHKHEYQSYCDCNKCIPF